MNYKINVLVLLLLVYAGSLQLHAQDNTLYSMRQIPQGTELNPAIQPAYNGYLQLPVLSSFETGIYNSGFSYWDAVHFGTGDQSDSLVIDLDQLANKLADRNYLRIENQVNIFGMGLRIGRHYFTLGISNKTEGRIGYPGDLVRFRSGNFNMESEQPRDINFSGLGADVINYTHLALGFGTEITPGLQVGGKIKRLWGTANLNSEKADMTLETNETDLGYEMLARTDMRFNVAFPLDIQRNDEGDFDGADIPGIAVDDLLFNGNTGFAFDIGATYKLNDSLDFSAAIVDLGGIKWDKNTHAFMLNGAYKFDGIDASPDENGDIALDGKFNDIADSLQTVFEPEVTSDEPYVSMLTTKVFLNANYRLTDKITFSALNRNLLYDGGVHPELTLAADIAPANWFSAKLSYSMMNRSYNNIGLGIGLRGGPFQFYLVQDNLSSLFWPHKAQAYTVRFGLNIVWGFQESIDQALIE